MKTYTCFCCRTYTHVSFADYGEFGRFMSDDYKYCKSGAIKHDDWVGKIAEPHILPSWHPHWAEQVRLRRTDAIEQMKRNVGRLRTYLASNQQNHQKKANAKQQIDQIISDAKHHYGVALY